MTGMTPWPNRSREEAALLNPAFLALVLHHGVQAYAQEPDNHRSPAPPADMFAEQPWGQDDDEDRADVNDDDGVGQGHQRQAGDEEKQRDRQ